VADIGRNIIRRKKSRDSKSIILLDLTFFPLETVLSQRAILASQGSIFYLIVPKQHQEIPDGNIGDYLHLLFFCAAQIVNLH
jgi:hypothetical protein